MYCHMRFNANFRTQFEFSANSRMSYVDLVQKLEKELGCELTYLKKSDLWTRARIDEEGEYINEEVKKIAKKIVS